MFKSYQLINKLLLSASIAALCLLPGVNHHYQINYLSNVHASTIHHQTKHAHQYHKRLKQQIIFLNHRLKNKYKFKATTYWQREVIHHYAKQELTHKYQKDYLHNLTKQLHISHIKLPAKRTQLSNHPIRSYVLYNKKHQPYEHTSSQFDSKICKDTLRDINKDRKIHHLSPVRLNSTLNELATKRSAESLKYYDNPNHIGSVHIDPKNNESYRDEIISCHHSWNRKYYNASENVTPIYFSPHFYWSGSISFHNEPKMNTTTPYNIAKNEELAMVKYDQSENNGHKANILSPTAHYVGIGVSCKQNKPVYEHNPNVHPAEGSLVENFVS